MASLPANGRRRRASRVAAGVVSAVVGAGLLAGCGGSSEPSGGGGAGEENTAPAPPPTAPPLPADRPSRPACALVTQAEVEAAIGARVSAGREEAQEARSVCSFTLAAAADQRVAIVSTSSSGVPGAFDAVRQNVEAPRSVPAGDQAFVSGGLGLVRKGDTMVTVLLVLKREPADLGAAATSLAQSVGSHL